MPLVKQNTLTIQQLLKLDEFLQKNSGKKKKERNLFWMDGYLAAICSSPRVVMPSEWQPNIMQDIEFESMEKAQEIFGLMMLFYNSTVQSIQDCSHTPIYDKINFTKKKKKASKDSNEKKSKIKSIELWCNAYLEGTRLSNPEVLQNKEMILEITPIIAGSQIANEKWEEGELNIDDFIEQIPLSVRNIYQMCNKSQKGAMQQSNSSPINEAGKLPHRNDPCFCGSGKKFKKCCLN